MYIYIYICVCVHVCVEYSSFGYRFLISIWGPMNSIKIPWNLHYPLVNKQFAIEHGLVEIVSFPIKNGDSP